MSTEIQLATNLELFRNLSRHHTPITGCCIVCEAGIAFKTYVFNSPLIETRTL